MAYKATTITASNLNKALNIVHEKRKIILCLFKESPYINTCNYCQYFGMIWSYLKCVQTIEILPNVAKKFCFYGYFCCMTNGVFLSVGLLLTILMFLFSMFLEEKKSEFHLFFFFWVRNIIEVISIKMN